MLIEPHGECELGTVQVITLGTDDGVRLQVLDLGATAHTLHVSGGDGVRRNVLLGHPTPQDRLDSTHYIGATIGRYANRIAGGTFDLDGRTVHVGTNDRGNALHGGPDGFDRRLWEVVEGDDHQVLLRLHSPDGDQGYPGALTAEVRYAVTADRVRVELSATTDAATPVNLTSHAYFNLDGEGSGTAEQHLLEVEAESYLPVDDTGIPTGAPAPVEGTPFDLRRPTVVADAVRRHHPQVAAAQGIDHNLVPVGSGWRRVAVLESPRVRTRMELHTDQEGLQVYTGNFLDGSVTGTGGGLYRQGDGVALEPQLFPDSPNRPAFTSPVLRPGETYRAALEWRFSTTG
jgi:galactose mutarotase-like enzyme